MYYIIDNRADTVPATVGWDDSHMDKIVKGRMKGTTEQGKTHSKGGLYSE